MRKQKIKSGVVTNRSKGTLIKGELQKVQYANQVEFRMNHFVLLFGLSAVFFLSVEYLL